MSFNKFKTKSYCVGGKHYSAITNIRGDITQNKQIGMIVKLLRGVCVTCKRNKSFIYPYNILTKLRRMLERKY